MELHQEFNDLEFEKQFTSGDLNPTYFSHEAHIRLAWIYITKYGLDLACEYICTQIQYFASKHGDPEKFNKTLTIAAVKTVNHFVQKSTTNNFSDFIKEFPRLKYNFKELLDTHYSFDIFNSALAKRKYLEPDLLSFQ